MELSFSSRDENGSERPSETGPRWTEAKCVSSPTTMSSHIHIRLKNNKTTTTNKQEKNKQKNNKKNNNKKKKQAILQTEEGKQIPRIIFIYLCLGCVHCVSLFSLSFLFVFVFVAGDPLSYLSCFPVVYSCRGATVMFSVSTKRNSESEICRSVRGKRTCLQGRHC